MNGGYGGEGDLVPLHARNERKLFRNEEEETLVALLHCSVENEEEEEKEFQMASLLHVSVSATSSRRKYLELL